MRKVNCKYLVKCDIPGCSNIAKHTYHTGIEKEATGIAICANCVKDLTTITKKGKINNEKEC